MKIGDIKEIFTSQTMREYVAALADNCLSMPKTDQHSLRVGLRYKLIMDKFLQQDELTTHRDLAFAISEIEALEKKEGSPPPKALAWKIDEAIGMHQDAFDKDQELGDRYFALLTRMNHYQFEAPDESYNQSVNRASSFEEMLRTLRSPDVLTHLGEREFVSALSVASGISLANDRPIPRDLGERVSALAKGFVRVGGANLSSTEPLMSLCDFYSKESNRRALRELVMLSALPSPFVHFATKALADTIQRTEFELHEMNPDKLGGFLHGIVYDADFKDAYLAEDAVREALKNLNRLDPKKFPKVLLDNFE